MTRQRVAVVAGASRGIGAAVVRRRSADRWAVIAVDRCADDPDVPYPLPATAALYDLADSGEFAGQQLLGRLLEPDEVAEVVAWACSPPAGALTGSVLHADGGFTG
jgi:NAD(P)-dependent dehydrogenase (short-subunit alcohol dehydrogenase family)